MPAKKPSAGGKAKKKGKSKKQGGGARSEGNFHPVPYVPEIVQTSIVVLSSPEDDILLKALKEILAYAEEREENLKRLYNKGLLTKLMPLLYKENAKVQAIAARLLDTYAEYEEVLDFFQLEGQHEHVAHITRQYLNASNRYVKEHLAKALSRFASRGILLDIVLAQNVEGAVWATLRSARDPKLQAYSLLLFHYLVLKSECLSVFLDDKDFSLRYLLCFLNSDYHDIQATAMEIQWNLSRCYVRALLEKVRSEKVVERLVELVLDDSKAHFRPKALAIIAAYVRHKENASDFVRSLEFVKLSRWVHDCDDAHVAVAAKIFEEISKFRDLLQIFVDFSVDISILSLFRRTDHEVVSQLCLILSRVSDHFHCCEKLAIAPVLVVLIGVLNQGVYDYIPSKDAAVETVHKFLKHVDGCKHLFYDSGGLRAIVGLYKTSRQRFGPQTFLKLMDVIHVYASTPAYAEEVMTKDLYKSVFEQFIGDPAPEVSSKAVAIIGCYLESRAMREYFLEIKGPRRVVRLVQKRAAEPDFLGSVLIFMRSMAAYKNVATRFLQEDVTGALKAVPASVAERLPAVHQTLDMFYSLNLPLKFYETGRLEIEDKLADNFYLVNGTWSGRFPFYEDLSRMKLSISTTFYLVSFATPAREALSRVKPPNTIYDYKSHRAFSSSGVLKKCSSLQKLRCVDTEHFEVVNAILSMAKRVPPRFEFGAIPADPYVSVMIEQVYLQVFNIERTSTVEEKAKGLAFYVARQLSGCRDSKARRSDLLCRQSYAYHINALKQKMGVNVIPVGFLKLGQQCERALLYKVLADKVEIPCALARGPNRNYWNEVPVTLAENENGTRYVGLAVVDLMKNVGGLYLVGTEAANAYCGSLERGEAPSKFALLQDM